MTLHPLEVAARAAALLPDDACLCYGVRCTRHGTCARYLAMDGAREVRTFIGSCITSGEFPLFVDAMQGGAR